MEFVETLIVETWILNLEVDLSGFRDFCSDSDVSHRRWRCKESLYKRHSYAH